MRQIKLFKHIEAELSELQKQINTWMEEIQHSGATIISVNGNIAPQTVGSTSSANRFSPSDLFVIIEYETNHD